jgi:hypothetical protein
LRRKQAMKFQNKVPKWGGNFQIHGIMTLKSINQSLKMC